MVEFQPQVRLVRVDISVKEKSPASFKYISQGTANSPMCTRGLAWLTWQ